MSYPDLFKQAEEFAKEAHDKHDGNKALKRHIEISREFALKLAEIENADKEVVELAAILHDIGKYKDRKEHHIPGSEMAREFLKDKDLPEEKKELIVKCIFKHRGKFSHEDNEIEVKIIQCADALSTLFDDEWQEYCRKKLSKEELLKKYDKTLKKINLDSARKLALPQVEKLKEVLK